MTSTLAASLVTLGATPGKTGSADVQEVDIPFAIPGKDNLAAKTHAWIYGANVTGVTPLVALHGGPGIPSNYLTPLIDLAQWMPVIIYDQVGCGKSTHFSDKMGDTAFWTEDLFVAELHNLLKSLHIDQSYSLIGHSWGGILGARFASDKPAGLVKLILASTPISIPQWLVAANRLRGGLPKEQRDILDKHEAENTTDAPEYHAAVQVFYDRHVLRILPNPDDVKASFTGLFADPTVYMTMNGPNEFHIIGPLKDWTGVPLAPKIAVPTLITNGGHDEAQDDAVGPWKDLIPNAEWKKFENSSHMAFWKEREAYIAAVKQFLL